MTKHTTTVSLLLAGLLAAGGAVHAQSASAGGTTSVAPKAGEASTQLNGVPNAQVPAAGVGVSAGVSASTDVSTKDQIRQGANGQTKAAVTSSVAPRSGEASTMVQGNPNADPNNPALTKSKSEKKMEKEIKKADAANRRQAAIATQMGAQAGAPAGTPPTAPAGTPSVFEGGTPK